MNEITRQPGQLPTTQGAQNFQRLRWTLPQFERLIEAGIFTEYDRVELIGGELVPMSPKGIRHEVVRSALHNWLRRNLADDINYEVELGWRPDGDTYIEPDLIIFPMAVQVPMVPAADVLLLIEVAHSSLADDKLLKAPVYAALGVAEYWVVDAGTLATTVHTSPQANAYESVWTLTGDMPLTPEKLPGLTLSIGQLMA